ncbi:MAG: hypothetical protein AAF066_12785 [Pseudomonadota bacterium]
MKRVIICLTLAFLGGCDQLSRILPNNPPFEDIPKTTTPELAPETVTPVATPPPPSAARTVEQFDTTSEQQRAAAVSQAKSNGGRSLGRTVASLGAAGEPGIWLKTTLVDRPQKGRVVYPAKGTRVVVDLIPLDNAAGGAQLSLAAMRLLQADLTSLPEVEVFALQ